MELLRKTVPRIVLTILSMGMLTLAFNVQHVKASGGTIHIIIRADGSIDPPDAPISTMDNITYTFTADIYMRAVMVERSNIMLDGNGYKLRGEMRYPPGVVLNRVVNVAVININIEDRDIGIWLYHASQCTISRNNITNCELAVILDYSSNNTICRNSIAENDDGIVLFHSFSNTISENDVINNVWDGIAISWDSNFNVISGNNVTKNIHGICLVRSYNNSICGNNIAYNDGWGFFSRHSYNNTVFHNNFMYNGMQACSPDSLNVWDNGYSSGGNYWSDYTGVDEKRGPNQDQHGGDGIGDTPYVIDAYNRDRYPLMKPWVPGHDLAAINVYAPKNVVGEGYSLNVSVTVANKGIYAETVYVTLYADMTEIETRKITLPSGNSTTISFTWKTKGFAFDNHTIWAYAWPAPGETYLDDNTFIDGWIIVTIPGDIDGDFKVDIYDVVLAASAYSSQPGDPNWNPNVDVAPPWGIINIYDVATVAANYGKKVN